MMTHSLRALPLLLVFVLSLRFASATPPEGTRARELDNLGRIHQDPNNSIIQEAWLLGRYHGQFYWSRGPEGNDGDFETRRFRYGGQMRMFNNLTVHAQAISGSDLQPWYNGFTELWAQWRFSPEFSLTVGQQKHRFTHDRNVSSRYLNYLERAMLTNMFGADYTPAVTAQGQIRKLTYYGGIFSNATGQNMKAAFAELDSGYSLLGAIYYEFGAAFGFDNITSHTSYVHSSANENATNLNRFDDGLSSAIIATRGSAALIVEAVGGWSEESGNAVGLNIQPSYFLSPKWQIVSRYQIAASNNDRGLPGQRRYERVVGMQPGDLYQAVYLGADHYIAKHRLKIMQGLEYSNMNGQDAWTASVMLRFYFGPHSGGAFPMNRVLPLEYD
jgi:hypothetical protein